MGGQSSTEQRLDVFEKNTVDIAVTGVWGAGKSSLVNALRGLSDFDEGAAETGVAQMTMEPKCYPHPAFPNVRIWDLPGIGRPGSEEKEYLEKVKNSQYDLFIIVACHCFTTYDIQLSHTIQKMGKRFYYVHSKMDVSIKIEKWKADFNKEATLKNTRKDCLRNLMGAGVSSPEVFLISVWGQDKYDFLLLRRTLENDINELSKRILRLAALQDCEKRNQNRLSSSTTVFWSTESSRKSMDGRSSTLVINSEPEETSAREKGNFSDLTASGTTTLYIAITGISGAGKSSLVNALRGLSDFDKGAAETGVTQTTMEPEGYPHSIFPDVTIWDLPGIGTPDFTAEEYLDRVNYSQYDLFIIVASNRFTIYDIQLSQAIQKMKKQFYYVQSKMDISIKNAKLHPDFNEETTLRKVRKYCLDNLVQAGISSPQIFLVSSWFQDKYDFPLLQRTLENEIEALKRHLLSPVDMYFDFNHFLN